MYCTYAATSYTCKPTAAGAGGPRAWSVVYSLLTTQMHYHRIRVSGTAMQRGLLTTPADAYASVPVPHRVVPLPPPPSSRIRARARWPHPPQSPGFPKRKIPPSLAHLILVCLMLAHLITRPHSLFSSAFPKKILEKQKQAMPSLSIQYPVRSHHQRCFDEDFAFLARVKISQISYIPKLGIFTSNAKPVTRQATSVG